MRGALGAAAGYAGLAVVITWPLARGLQRDVAWDLGDPLLVMWALAWDCRQILAILSGDWSNIASFFDGNIFHPAPLALAHSEHLVGEALQMLPVYALTGNPILGYNLLYLSTFVLSGLGTFLLVRELTGSAPAGFVAGLVFAFAPYRIPQSSHLHILSSQWMPFALYGIRRYVDHGRFRALLGAAAAVTLQGLSSGYHLLYFTPFAVAYFVWEAVRRDLWRSQRLWWHAGGAALVPIALIVPFLLPYLTLAAGGTERHRDEVIRFSADVYSYVTAFPGQPVWGRLLQIFPKAEGDLFPGLTALLLAAIGAWACPRAAAAEGGIRLESHRAPGARRLIVAATGYLSILHLVAAIAVLAERRIVIDLGVAVVRMTNVDQLLLRAAVLAAISVGLSPHLRTLARRFAVERGYFVAALIMAVWLSLGPSPQSLGRPVDLAGVYGLLLDHVPGYTGLRVPARFVVVATLMLAVLAGFGAAHLGRRRGGPAWLGGISLLLLAEGAVHPFVVNGAEKPEGYDFAEARLAPPDEAPAVYRHLRGIRGPAVVAELPIGVPDFDLRAVYYAATHWKPVVNGYSGFFPPHYGRLVLALSDVPHHADLAWRALGEAGATHVIVHEHVYVNGSGHDVTTALVARGASVVLRAEGDVLIRIR